MLLEHQKGDFCGADGQALADGSAASTNILDLVAARHQLGVGRELFLWLTTRVIETGHDDSDYQLIFQQDSAEAFNSGGLDIEVFRISMVGTDPRLETAGAVIHCSSMPQNVYHRYVRWYFTCTDNSGTAAVTVNAGFGPDTPHSHRTRGQIYVSNVGTP